MTSDPPPGPTDMWVFGYGSLMWRPDFPHAENQPALLRGYHRALCILSTHYRGTQACPGLVVGLDRGGSCRGRALRVAAKDVAEVKEYLWERELDTYAYVAKWLPVGLPAQRVTALCFVVDRANGDQYAGKLTESAMVDMVLQGRGNRGTALDYLENTIAHLDDLGIGEGLLHRVLNQARSRAGGQPGEPT